jgi:hypothetical protein
MAHTHLHRPSAALDAFAALAGVKSGSDVYVLRMAPITLAGMLSLWQGQVIGCGTVAERLRNGCRTVVERLL